MTIPTDSAIYRYGTTPVTRSVVSSKNRIFAPGAGGNQLLQIGVTASFSPSESRAVEPVRGIGFGDVVAELVPGVTEPMTIAVVRTALYLSNVYQVMGYNAGTSGLVRSLRHHRFPFDMRHEIIFSQLTENANANNVQQVVVGTTSVNALITFFEGCWMSSWSSEYAADAAMVQENVDIMVTDITDGVSTYGEFIDSGLSGTNNEYISQMYS